MKISCSELRYIKEAEKRYGLVLKRVLKRGGVYHFRKGKENIVLKVKRLYAKGILENEARVLDGLKDLPFVANVLDQGEIEGGLELLKSYIPGRVVYRRLLDIKARMMLAQARERVGLIHERGYASLELHPGNIFLTRTGVQFTDFETACDRYAPNFNHRKKFDYERLNWSMKIGGRL